MPAEPLTAAERAALRADVTWARQTRMTFVNVEPDTLERLLDELEQREARIAKLEERLAGMIELNEDNCRQAQAVMDANEQLILTISRMRALPLNRAALHGQDAPAGMER